MSETTQAAPAAATAVEPRGLLIDVVRCSGCRECVKACRKGHGFDEHPKVPDLSATAYTAVVERGGANVRKLCRHCVNPSCASVCPVAALQKTALGPVTYDVSRCIGCRYCMVACPYGVPRYEWDDPVPSVRKCDLCADRLAEGKPNRCAEACTYEATVAGTRADLLRLAHERIAEMPDEYDAHVYGETEGGGTSVLYLLPRDMATLDRTSIFPASIGNDPLPMRTWEVLRKIPAIAVTGGASMLAFWWITRRRDEVAEWERARLRSGRPAASPKHTAPEEN
jgi:formate dehydrogenase iron-sulfur subunit